MLVISDVHIGFNRKGGTTPQSQEALRDYLINSFTDLLTGSEETELLILGDLFDDFEVTSRDLRDTFFSLYHGWLANDKKLYLVAGNHDWSPRGSKVSSFEVLAGCLKTVAPDLVHVVAIDDYFIYPGADEWVALAHCGNQDIFNLKLREILEDVVVEGTRVFLHANFDNNFAAQSDHSLNVSREQAEAFRERGAKLYFAHEHQTRHALGGHVIVFGNQWPTSIADCLENEYKSAHVFGENSLHAVRTWDEEGVNGFAMLRWDELAGYTGSASFIRVSGEAASSQASEVIDTIAKFRQTSTAFVITNAVKVEGIAEIEELPEQFEAAKAFNVMEFFAKHLEPAEMSKVRELLGFDEPVALATFED